MATIQRRTTNRRQLEQTRRQRETDARARDRKAVRELRARVKDAKRTVEKRYRAALGACGQLRQVARAQRRALREHVHAEYLRASATLANDARIQCDALKTRVTTKGTDSVRRALAALDAEQQHQDTLRRWQRRKMPTEEKVRKRFEAKAESDSEVESSIPSELLPVWRKVRNKIQASGRRSRLEAFEEWVQEHRSDVYRIFEDDAQQYVSQLVEREAELRERSGSRANYQDLTDEQLDEVPF